MTQKELLYVEDAIMHEKNVIAYLDYLVNTLEDDNLITFINEQTKKHEDIKKKLTKELEVTSND